MQTTLNISLIRKVNEIQDVLNKSTKVKYTFIEKNGPIQYKYIAEGNMDQESLAQYTRQLIKSIPNGNVIMFRVLIDGQFFEHGKIYQKEDKEYKATQSGR